MKVCVIGAGVAGLVTVKECLAVGLEPLCLERLPHIGGIWQYTDSRFPHQGAAVYKSMVTNTAKELTNFSDFLYPESAPLYPTHYHVIKYLHDYADNFQLKDHIKLNTTVDRVAKSDDHDVTGKWEVTYREGGGDVTRTDTFDAVVCCAGFFREAIWADTPGLDKFPGTKIHSIDYRDGHQFADQRVLVIGNSHSAGDIAVSVCAHARQVYLSIGPGTVVVPRSFLLTPRVALHLPRKWRGRYLNHVIDRHMQDDICRMKPVKSGPGYMVNDEIINKVAGGKVIIQGQLEQIQGHTAVFEGQQKVEGIDAVICATGFKPTYNYLDTSLQTDKLEDFLVYKQVWPAREKHNTLAFVGNLALNGAFPVILEHQARWVTQVLAGNIEPPDRKMMEEETRKRNQASVRRFGKWMYMAAPDLIDDLAQEYGAMPSLSRYFLRDPKLWWTLMMGPMSPVQYRLQGPGSKPVWARQMLLTAAARNTAGMRTRLPPKAPKTTSTTVRGRGLRGRLMPITALIVGVSACYWYKTKDRQESA